MKLPDFATDKNRWYALVFLSLGLAIVIVDNTVLNVAIPYILRDLKSSFDALQWVISGYALIIATILITVGRMGDVFGRKKIFLIGTILFAIGSFIASISQTVVWLFIGEALIEAVGAAMMLTSSLALLVSEFHGKERSIAFGVWGSVAGAAASLGPLLGGYLTSYYSWRWSLRINVLIAIIAILGSVFIKEAKGDKSEKFDWLGTIFSGLGLFFLIFGFIEGRNYGWWTPNQPFSIGNWSWPLTNISIIPYAFGLAALFLTIFIWVEYLLEKNNGEPLMRLSLFKDSGFSFGLITLGIVVMGQFGAFLIFPLYFQNALGLNAMQTGVVFLWTSVAAAIFGSLSGYMAAKIGPKWVVVFGMIASVVGTYWMSAIISINSNGWTLGPALFVFGIGIGAASAQLTNVILSRVPPRYAGEASAVNATIRQVGTSIGIALIGTIFASATTVNIVGNIHQDNSFPSFLKEKAVQELQSFNPEGGLQGLQNRLPRQPICNPSQTSGSAPCISPAQLKTSIDKDIKQAIVDAAKAALQLALVFIVIGAVCSLLIPNKKPLSWSEVAKLEKK